MNPNPLTAFLARYSWATHSIAVAIVFLFGSYAEVPALQSYVNALAAHLPAWVDGGVAAAVALYFHYRNGQSAPAEVVKVNSAAAGQ
jgi:hypothetical protein